MLSDIFIFVKMLKLQFLSQFKKMWQYFGKIQSLGPKFSRNFSRNFDKIVGAATLSEMPQQFWGNPCGLVAVYSNCMVFAIVTVLAIDECAEMTTARHVDVWIKKR